MIEGASHSNYPATSAPAVDDGARYQSFEHQVGDERLRFIPSGPERMDALLRMISEAQISLRLIVYIFDADAAGMMLRDALSAAAARGVAVTLILDSFGSADTPEGFFAALTKHGAKVHWFSARWTPRYLIRNHVKLYIADDREAMFGGFNIASGYFKPPATRDGWHDLGVTITGPSVATLITRFDVLADWVAQRRPSWAGLARIIRSWRAEGRAVEWLVGGPGTRLSRWARSVKQDLQSARDVTLIMAYFAPGQSLLRRIGRIGRLGRAHLLLPSRSDNGATIGAARALYGFLLKRGVTISEYQPEWLHLKLIVIDDISYIGSANFDMRSLFINLELMLRIKDAALANKLRAFAHAHEVASEPISYTQHRQRASWWTRLRWWLAWAAVSLVDYGVTRRLNFGIDRDD